MRYTSVCLDLWRLLPPKERCDEVDAHLLVRRGYICNLVFLAGKEGRFEGIFLNSDF